MRTSEHSDAGDRQDLREVRNEEAPRCQQCNGNAAEPVHPCPYQHEINDNADDFCNCCPECRQECVWDIG